MPKRDAKVSTDLLFLSSEALPDLSPFPAPVYRDALFSYRPFDVGTEWQTLIDTLPVDAVSGHPKPALASGVSAAVADTYLDVVPGYEVPTVVAGRLYAHIDSDSHSAYNMVRARVPNNLLSNYYLKQLVVYRFRIVVEITDSSGWSQSIPWANIFEINGAYSEDWLFQNQHPVDPILEIGLNRADYGTLTLEAKLKGTKDPEATAWEYSHLFSTPISLGSHVIEVWLRKDHRGNNGYARFTLDDQEVGEAIGVKIGTPFDMIGDVPALEADIVGGIPQVGMRTPQSYASPGVGVYISEYEIYKEPTIPSEPEYTVVNSFTAGDIDPAAWNANRLAFPNTSTTLQHVGGPIPGSGNPRANPGGNNGRAAAVGHIGMSAGPLVDFDKYNEGHELPTMNNDGEFEFFHSTLNHDSHTMVMPQETNGVPLGGYRTNEDPDLLAYVRTTRLYKTLLVLRFPDAFDKYNVPWILLWQSGSHHIAVFLKNGIFAVEVLQTSQTVLQTIKVQSGGTYTIEVEYKLSSGADAYTKVDINGVTLFESTTPNYLSGGTFQTIGNYQSRFTSKGATVIGSRYQLAYTG